MVGVLFQFLCLAAGVFAIAGAAISARDEVQLEADEAQLSSEEELRMKLKTCQDLFICIIVWSLLAMLIGLAAQHAHASPSTKYEVSLHQASVSRAHQLVVGQREEGRGEEGR